MEDKIYNVYDLVCRSQNASCDKVTEAYNNLLDWYEEYGEYNQEYLNNFKNACLDASKHAGYTNIQHGLLAEVTELLNEI